MRSCEAAILHAALQARTRQMSQSTPKFRASKAIGGVHHVVHARSLQVRPPRPACILPACMHACVHACAQGVLA